MHRKAERQFNRKTIKTSAGYINHNNKCIFFAGSLRQSIDSCQDVVMPKLWHDEKMLWHDGDLGLLQEVGQS